MGKREGADALYRLLSLPVREKILALRIETARLQEIRMRAGRPLLLKYDGTEAAVTEEGRLSVSAEDGFVVTEEMVNETLEYISGYSLYAFDEEMRQGFLTLPGGHRVGLAGRIVTEGGKIQCIRHISFLNIRLAHQKIGCGDPVMPYLVQDGEICHTLILSPPGGGKTTLLRDIVRQISNGSSYAPGRTVGVVDERSEIAGSYLGIPQNDVGIRTDVLDCCSRPEGMMMLLRSMAPQVIAVDELGGEEDGSAVRRVFYCGCHLLATAHGSSVEEIRKNPLLRELVQSRMFERYVVLHGSARAGRVREILDGEERVLYRDGRRADA